MGSDVSRSRVGDFVTLQRGTTYRGDLVGKPGPVLLGLGSIEPGGGFREGHYKTFGGECPGKLMLYPGDIYVALKGATKDGSMIGSVARVPSTVASGRLTQDTAKLEFKVRDVAAKRYLYWALRTPEYREHCASRQRGTTAASLGRDDLLAYAVPPMTSTRQHLVELLDDLEAKIELSRRMSQTLESMAHDLFHALFIDSGPERIGVPGGWREGRLGDVAELLRISENPQDHPTVTYKHYSLPAFDEGRRPIAESGWRIKSVKSKVPGDAVLVSKLNPEIERVWLVDCEPTDQAVCSTEFLVLRARQPYGRAFLYCLARSQGVRTHLEASVTGTSRSHQRVQPDVLLDIPIAIPPSPAVAQFEQHAAQLLRRAAVSGREASAIHSIRASLLSRLVSGGPEAAAGPAAGHVV